MNLRNILPCATVDNHLDGRGRDAEHLCDLRSVVLSGCPQAANLAHLIRHEFGAIATTQVDDASHCFKMLRIAARTITTKMVQLKTIWDFALIPLVIDAMRKCCLSIRTNQTIPASGHRPIPYPTSGFRINCVVVRGAWVFPALMAIDVPLGLADHIAGTDVGLWRKWSFLSTTAHAHPRRVRLWNALTSCFILKACAVWSCARLALPYVSVPTTILVERLNKLRYRQIAITTRAILDRLGAWHFDLLSDRGVAMPRAITVAPGHFACLSSSNYSIKARRYGLFYPTEGL